MLCAPLLALAVAAPQDAPSAVERAVHQRFLELAAEVRWPGFDAATIPVALVDDGRTTLFAHPSPPAGFEPLGDPEDGVVAADLVPSTVRADGPALVGEVLAAALFLEGDPPEVDPAAAELVGHAFRVHVGRELPSWAPAPGARFLYPAEDAEVVVRRRLEVAALRRALLAEDGEEAAGWVRRALDERRERYARLPDGARELERALERSEGLAHHAATRAAGRVPALELPEEGFAPDAHVDRSRATGTALAALLDRFSEPWRARLLEEEGASLDALLHAALTTPDVDPPDFAPEERASLEDRAVLDTMRYRIARERARTDFTSRPGWSVEVHAAEQAPLFVLDVAAARIERIDGATLLHGRGLEARNLVGSVALPGRDCLTYAAGEHPLFQGVARILVTGLADEPEIVEEGRGVTVRAPGLEIELRSGTARREEQRWHVELGSL